MKLIRKHVTEMVPGDLLCLDGFVTSFFIFIGPMPADHRLRAEGVDHPGAYLLWSMKSQLETWDSDSSLSDIFWFVQ